MQYPSTLGFISNQMHRTTVPSLPRDPRVPDDCDSAANDHLLDATSYAIAGEASGRVQQSSFTPEPRMPRDERVVWV